MLTQLSLTNIKSKPWQEIHFTSFRGKNHERLHFAWSNDVFARFVQHIWWYLLSALEDQLEVAGGAGGGEGRGGQLQQNPPPVEAWVLQQHVLLLALTAHNWRTWRKKSESFCLSRLMQRQPIAPRLQNCCSFVFYVTRHISDRAVVCSNQLDGVLHCNTVAMLSILIVCFLDSEEWMQ